MGFQSFLSQNTNLSLYAEWKMRKAGVYTLRELFDMDFKECCSLALDYGNFCALMEDRGYEVRHRSRYPSFFLREQSIRFGLSETETRLL